MARHWFTVFAAGAGLLSLVASAPSTAQSEPSCDSLAQYADSQAAWDGWGAWGVNTNTIDRGVRPGDNFFRFANGCWLDRFEIPADQATYGTFMMLRDNSERDVGDILETLRDQPDRSTPERIAGDYFNAWMDTGEIERRGVNALAPYLAQIRSVDSHAALYALWATRRFTGPFNIAVFPDPADPNQYVAGIFQGGLMLPDRDYYLRDEERFAEIRDSYRAYLEHLFTTIGADDAVARADRVFELETEIAGIHWTAAESRQIQRIYNPMSLDALQDYAPEIDWQAVLEPQGLGDLETFIVGQNTAIQELAALVDRTPISDWQYFLIAHFINNNAGALPSEISDAQFALFSRQIRGIAQRPDRWREGVRQVNAGIGEALGQAYLDRHFPPQNRQEMERMLDYVTRAFEARLHANPWMDDETREGALAKLATFEARIAAPENWTDYSSLEIDPQDALGNRLRVADFLWQEQLRRLGSAVDRDQWPYPPQTVNASYNPLLNQLTFPAGILQPPFFNVNADPAVNFGGIGATIGHEMGHGFDDQGSQFDATGRLRNWWTEASREAFNARAAMLVAQYNEFEPIEGMTINGELTLGENIGDLGGLELAYAGWRLFVEENYPDGAPVIDGFTGDQRFFLAYTQVWRGLRREDSLREQLLTDPHSPYDARVNGVLRNMASWYAAFDIQPSDALYLPPGERVSIW